MNANVTDGCLIPIDYCRAHDYHRRFYVLQLDLQHTMHRSTEDRHQRLERVDHVTHANDVTLETQMQFIQTRAYERKCKCKRKLARERKRARGKRKILRARITSLNCVSRRTKISLIWLSVSSEIAASGYALTIIVVT